jgi:hypothetical protein
MGPPMLPTPMKPSVRGGPAPGGAAADAAAAACPRRAPGGAHADAAVDAAAASSRSGGGAADAPRARSARTRGPVMAARFAAPGLGRPGGPTRRREARRAAAPAHRGGGGGARERPARTRSDPRRLKDVRRRLRAPVALSRLCMARHERGAGRRGPRRWAAQWGRPPRVQDRGTTATGGMGPAGGLPAPLHRAARPARLLARSRGRRTAGVDVLPPFPFNATLDSTPTRTAPCSPLRCITRQPAAGPPLVQRLAARTQTETGGPVRTAARPPGGDGRRAGGGGGRAHSQTQEKHAVRGSSRADRRLGGAPRLRLAAAPNGRPGRGVLGAAARRGADRRAGTQGGRGATGRHGRDRWLVRRFKRPRRLLAPPSVGCGSWHGRGRASARARPASRPAASPAHRADWAGPAGMLPALLPPPYQAARGLSRAHEIGEGARGSSARGGALPPRWRRGAGATQRAVHKRTWLHQIVGLQASKAAALG